MATKSKMLLMSIMGWYAKLDKETLDLSVRFFMKGASTGDLNTYVKGVLRRELGVPENGSEPKTITVPAEEPVPSTQR